MPAKTAMTVKSAMTELKAAGTAQNRKVYGRHGVTGPMFGVSYANLKTMAKKIRTDHELAKKLWATGNHDARILATMVADPEQLDAKTIDAWVKDMDCHPIGDAFGGLVAETKFAVSRAGKWSKSKNDFIGQVGWNLYTHLAMGGSEDDPDGPREWLKTIEEQIHARKNRTKHAMNMALCGIGIGCPDHRHEAIATAKRIGKVEVDHGETSCKTPDAVAYIQKAAARRKVRTC